MGPARDDHRQGDGRQGGGSYQKTGSYRDAGVDIEAGYEVVRRIKKFAAAASRPGVIGGLGGFGGLFALDGKRYTEPVLVSGADGVGTKLAVAFKTGRHSTVGIDAVAMCVNDIVAQGAEPLFFLDYLAMGRLVPAVAEEVVAGVAEGCRQAGCALIGGETAEMPGFYREGEYDLAGFAVGVVEREKIVDGRGTEPGDLLIGLASSGLHSNGFSLTRRIFFDKAGLEVDSKVAGLSRPLGEELLTPTRIYVPTVRALMERFRIKGIAHITGGGFYENIPRALGEGCRAQVQKGSWPVPPIFHILQELGGVSDREMFNTYNMGIGMVLIVSGDDAPGVLAACESLGERAFSIGRVAAGPNGLDISGIS
ncbi:MAG: phosphoribosylformylglycinamidine cyclo-ligase [Syntrophothermus sp.]